MLNHKIIKIAKFLFIAQKINDIKNRIKQDLIARQYGKNIKQNKLNLFEQKLKQKSEQKYQQFNNLVTKTLGDVSIVVNKYLQKNSPQTLWFYNRYLKQNKHIQDIIDFNGNENQNGSLVGILKKLSEYQKYDKTTKKQLRQGIKNNIGRLIVPPKFDVTINSEKQYDFNSLIQLMNEKNKKQVPSNSQLVFDAPKTIPQIKIPGISSYKVYKAMGNNKKHFQQLHNIDGLGTKNENARNVHEQYQKYYASWCVVTGTVNWGNYLCKKYNYYYYITKSDNTPYILMNFGYDSDAQIKDINDSAFSNYDQQIFNIIDYLAKKDNFNPTDATNDYSGYIAIKKVKQKELDVQTLQLIQQFHNYKAYSENGKPYNRTVFIYKDNEPCFVINNDNILKTNNKQKITQPELVDMLILLNKQTILLNLIRKGIISNQNEDILDKIINNFIQEAPGYIINLVNENKIQINDKLIKKMLTNENYSHLSNFIIDKKITDEKLISDIVKKILNSEGQQRCIVSLMQHNVLPMKFYNKAIQYCIKSKRHQVCLRILQKNLYTKNNLPELILACLYEVSFSDLNLYINNDNQVANKILQKLLDGNTKKSDKGNKHFVINEIINDYEITEENLDKYSKIITKTNNKQLLRYTLTNTKSKKLKEKLKNILEQNGDDILSLSFFVKSGEIVGQQKDKIVEKLIDKKMFGVLTVLIISEKITDQNTILYIINKLIKNKDAQNLHKIINSSLFAKLNNESKEKIIKLSIQNIIDKTNYICDLYLNETIPVEIGYKFLKYISDSIYRVKIPKKYFTEKFVQQLAKLNNSELAMETITKQMLPAKKLIIILDIMYNKNEQFKNELITSMTRYNFRPTKPYRITFYQWVIEHDFKQAIEMYHYIQDEFKPTIIQKIIDNNDITNIENIINNNYSLAEISLKTDQIYNKFKNKLNTDTLIKLTNYLNRENKSQLIHKIIETKNLDNINHLLNRLHSNKQNYQFFAEIIQSLPMQIFENIKLYNIGENQQLDSLVTNKILNECKNSKTLAKALVNKLHYQFNKQLLKTIIDYLLDLINTKTDFTNAINEFGIHQDQIVKEMLKENKDKTIGFLIETLEPNEFAQFIKTNSFTFYNFAIMETIKQKNESYFNQLVQLKNNDTKLRQYLH